MALALVSTYAAAATPRTRCAGHMLASYYGAGEYLHRHTASGERFDPQAMTAAHRTLPFGTRLSVCFRRCTAVRVNDRGPAASTGRSLDLSLGAARAIGLTGAGVARVRAAVLP
jgi:rare lipoprotein A